MNSGQTAKVKVTAVTSKGKKAPKGSVKTSRRNGYLYVTVDASTPLRVKVTVSAAAVPGYTSFTRVRSYRVHP
jgi:hypothetical protein